MITGVALAAVSGGAALAQSAPMNTTGGESAVGAPQGSATKVQEFVVTGSRIPQPNLTSISPVTAVNSQELKLEGTTRVEDLINQLPQVVGSQGAFVSNGSSGTATIDLRGLGAKRNLVLIDGTRLGPGDPGTPVADINFIPAALIDRVDLLTGGASAVYGADAVAGVVNFIMKKDFTGVQLSANYAAYQHNNSDAKSEAANAAADYDAPTGSVYDGQTVDISLIFGANSPDGRGNVEGYVEYRHVDPVTEASRDYSFCSIAVTGQNFSCGGSATAKNATILTYDAAFNPTGQYQVSPTGVGALVPFTGSPTQLYNYAPENYFQRDDRRYSGGFFAHYDITPHMTAYAKFMFMDDQSAAQIAESGDFAQTASIPCNNPLLSAAEVNALCVIPGYSTAAAPTVGTAINDYLLRRNVEGGPRISDIEHVDYRATVGLKGDLDSNWHFDAYGQFYQSILNSEEQDYLSNAKLVNALDAVPGPNGTAVCASATAVAAGCVPYDPFTPGGVTAAQLAYLEVPGLENGITTESIVEGDLTGDLGAYGVKSPLAKEGVGVSFGADYRGEFLSTSPDEETQLGDLAGSGGKTPPVSGGFNVKEVYAEARIPIVDDMPFVKELTADLGYRYSHYSDVGDTQTYKLSGEWAINDDIRIRGGFNRAVRAPNVDELFTVQSVALDGSADPCSTATPVYTAAQCANTGVSAAQYGHISANPAAQYNGLVGGNPNLKPETANTYTIGVVLTPVDFVKGISLSADYFNIDITNVIQSYGFQNILDDCATTGDAVYCSLVHRAPGNGSLWLQPTGFVVDTLQNLGYLKTSGVDFTFDYRFRFTDFGMPDYGGLTLNFLGTYTNNFDQEGAPGTPVTSCAGKFGPTCGIPQPFFKAKTRLTWMTPIDGLSASVDWRYLGAVNLDTGATDTADSHIPEYSYFDLAAQWRVKDRYTFSVGVNNIFDIQPPVIGAGELGGISNANTYPQTYDPLGRYLFASVTAAF
jgi:outer membrane receptor protein involved in Fe transport